MTEEQFIAAGRAFCDSLPDKSASIWAQIQTNPCFEPTPVRLTLFLSNDIYFDETGPTFEAALDALKRKYATGAANARQEAIARHRAALAALTAPESAAA